MNFPLYVWCENTNQVLAIDSSHSNTADKSALGIRRQTIDLNYGPTSAFRFGSYMYVQNRWIAFSWESCNIEDLSKDFKASLVLMGIAYEQ